jgi:hypothetical protein
MRPQGVFSHKPALVAFGLGAFALGVVGVALLLALAKKAPPASEYVEPAVPSVPLPRATEVVGTVECLPYRYLGPGQPATVECAFGVTADDGTNYAVDLAGAGEGAMMAFQAGKRVRISGTMVPVEALSSDHWRVYDIRGVWQADAVEYLP